MERLGAGSLPSMPMTASAGGNGEEIMFRTYHYKDGKGEETVYYKKDMLELSMESYTIPVGSENYGNIVKQIKDAQRYTTLMPNSMFSETYEVMKDFYEGRIDRDNVKEIFKEYCYHMAGKSDETVPGEYRSQRIIRVIAGLYEYFSRANTRMANTENNREGKELLEQNGLNYHGSTYYNADWYYACEEMQQLFRDTADELADEYGAEYVDYKRVEKETIFMLDGGITFNGVWNACQWQNNVDAWGRGQTISMDAVPPKGFVYCVADLHFYSSGMAGGVDKEQIKENIERLNGRKSYANRLFLFAQTRGVTKKMSQFLNTDKQDGRDFLRKFTINFRQNQVEFMWAGE